MIRSSRAVVAALILAASAAVPAAAQTESPGSTLAPDTAAVPPAATQALPAKLEVVPPAGSVGEEVRLIASGLPAGAQVTVLGGQDPAQLASMQQVDRADPSGNLRMLVTVPDTVENGDTFHFALQVGTAATQPVPFKLQSRVPDPTSQ